MAREDKRRQIMRAAERLFTSRRFHEITLDDVARDAQVGKGTIYRHFEDKDDLFFQVAMSGFDALCELVRAKAGKGADFEDRLLSACEAISEFFAKRRQLFRMMQSEDARLRLCGGAPHNLWLAKRRALSEALGEILAEGVECGRVRDDAPSHALATYLLGLLRARARSEEDEPDGLGDMRFAIDLFLRGAEPGKGGVGLLQSSHRRHMGDAPTCAS